MSEDEFKQRLKEHEAYNILDFKHVKHPYYCGECHAEFWLSSSTIMERSNLHKFPCGHGWNKTYFKPVTWEAFKAHNPLSEVSI